jgi:putative tricarboxylic transport membrane protein
MEQIVAGFASSAPAVFSLHGLLVIGLGVAFGVVAGAIPGIGSALMLTLALPFTFEMSPLLGLSLLASIWTGSQYSSSIPAILINTPAAASSVPTTIDGYRLHQMGRGGEALGVSLITGFIGGLAATIVLTLIVIPLGQFALAFGPAEYFGVALLGLAAVSSMADRSFIKTVLSVVFGLAVGTIGMDFFTGARRFTFGVAELIDGVPLIPAIIGLFALSEVAMQAERLQNPQVSAGAKRVVLPSLATLRWLAPVTGLSTVIGIIVGIMPGAGGSVASFVSYSEGRKVARDPETYGKGSLEGVAAAETSNNAVVAGDLAPTLALGVPGSVPAAIMMSALLVEGIWPGPMLFSQSPDVVYGLFIALAVANVFMVICGILVQPLALQAAGIPAPLLLPGIVAIVLTGAFASTDSLFGVHIALVFGGLGYVMRKLDFSCGAAVLGLVLGPIFETSLRRALGLSHGDPSIFFTQPISLTLILIALLLFFMPLLRRLLALWRRRRRTGSA